MAIVKYLTLAAAALSISGCAALDLGDVGPDKSIDRGLDSKHLSQLKAGVWIDPEGCDHWIIDDGVEGYLTARVDDYGRPICSGAGPVDTAVGPFKSGSSIGDPL
ncbi:hypothetical protein [Thioclava pacifica]|uniref:Lipoprotein n=1 Tax=Thioclava pacifica DSM 10166 TaxID=1353537 RepID=A0A074JBE7_9RHOB|nr:hypothetical protein [Thioclava pacifica]KEO52908.1 hypothetical protein TP2_08180 [Thioclava pacifica DSM 10166]